jgi:peptidyl-tRNA hydrolase, PTH1 family
VPSAIKLIVGMGNPGSEHLMTRHNAGFWFADVLAARYSLKFHAEARFKSEICRLSADDHDCYICKPMTYMNRSGQAVQAVSGFYKIALNEILVVHDEIDLDAGVIRFKQGGGHGGHNGLRDIIEKMGGNEFNRLRIGVGHPGNSSEVINYVLNRPAAEDQELIMQGIGDVMDLIPQILAGEFQKVMHKLHTGEKLEVKSEEENIEDKNNDKQI